MPKQQMSRSVTGREAAWLELQIERMRAGKRPVLGSAPAAKSRLSSLQLAAQFNGMGTLRTMGAPQPDFLQSLRAKMLAAADSLTPATE